MEVDTCYVDCSDDRRRRWRKSEPFQRVGGQLFARTTRVLADRARNDGSQLRVTRKFFDTLALGPPPGTRYEWLTASGDVRVLRVDPLPPRRRATAILYLHGGGYVFGSARSHKGLAAHLARLSEATAWIPEYRLAPESPFPAALDDAKAAYRALLQSGHLPGQVVIAGDSAGGHLAASLLVELSTTGELPMPGATVLLSPVVDFSCTNLFRLDGSLRDPFMSPAYAQRCMRAYAGGADLTDPRIAVLEADKINWPPTLIQVGGTECLARDATLMAASFPAGRCTLQVWPGQVHVFQAVPFLTEGRAALRSAGHWIRSHLHGRQP